MINGVASDYYNKTLTNNLFTNIESWLNLQNIDLTKFDQNQDGQIDLVIFIEAFDLAEDGFYYRVGMSGAFASFRTYYDTYSDLNGNPKINAYTNLPLFFLYENFDTSDYSRGITSQVIIHEFGHNLGVSDLYENSVNMDVVGRFDMQSNNEGDWNPLFKFGFGWITPTIIDGTKDEYEITINAYSTTGDAIVIPILNYDYNGSPFEEYIIIDLFAHDGLYSDSSRKYGLENAVGVRIFHVNNKYENRTYTKKDGTTGILATQHYSASISSKFAHQGKYNIELIQNGNVNTFTTGIRTTINSEDLFYENDTFDVKSYDNFFYNGLMDNNMDLGYKVTIKEIVSDNENSTATILITKN